MKIENATLLLTGLLAVSAGCGDDDDPIMQEPLPESAQLLPTEAVLDFPVTAMSLTSTRTLGITNGGQEDLVISAIDFSGDDADLFSVDGVSPDNGSSDSVPFTIPTRQTGQLTFAFAPGERGVFRAQVTLTSNAENFPTAVLELVGPGVETTTGPALPDIAAIDDPVVPLEPDGLIAIVGFYNLGRDSLVITGYEIGDTSLFDFNPASAPPIPGASCAANGEADCNTGGTDDDRNLFCFSQNTPDTMDDVCAVTVPGEQFLSFTLDVLGSGSTTFTVTSNDGDTPALTISLEN